MPTRQPEPVRRMIDITAGLTESLVTWPGVVERFERHLLTSLDTGDPMTVSRFQLGAHAVPGSDGAPARAVLVVQ